MSFQVYSSSTVYLVLVYTMYNSGKYAKCIPNSNGIVIQFSGKHMIANRQSICSITIGYSTPKSKVIIILFTICGI